MKKLILTLAALTTLAACGGAADNVAACNKWKAAVKCGTANIDTISCDSYASTTCDISAFFDCMSTVYVCVNGAYDTTKLANISSCVSKNTCK